jgi:adenylate cyclase
VDKDHHPSTQKRHKWIEIALGGFCTLIILGVMFIPVPLFNTFMTALNGTVYDHMIRMGWHTKPINPKVVIIDIDDASVQKEGRWPWPRDKMARLIDQLKEYGVVTVALDIVMSEPEVNYALGLKNKVKALPNQSPEEKQQLTDSLDKIAQEVDNDTIFTEALSGYNVVLSFLLHDNPEVKKGSLPTPLLNENNQPLAAMDSSVPSFQGYNSSLDAFAKTAADSGFVTNIPDPDGTIRHSLLLAHYDKQLYPNLALATAMNYLLIEHINPINRNGQLSEIGLEGLSIPTNAAGQILIPFWGKSGTLDYYSATDILHNKVNPEELKGSIAIIGSSMILLSDLHQSPVGQLFPGVEMIGNVVQGIVGQQITVEYNWYTVHGVALLIFLGLILALLIPLSGILGKFLIALLSLGLLVTGIISLFIFKNIYIPPALPLCLILLQILVNYTCEFILERRQKRKINQLFGQYVPKEYVEKLIDDPQHSSMEGETRTMTVQFTDIRNFTSISETLDASGVKQLLNSFLTPVTEIIFNHSGTIDKYVGDMIIAFWGAPMEDKQHARHAIQSAQAVFKQLSKINENLMQQGLPAISIGMGIATGPMNVGDMGSEFRRAYTVLGDTVNIASRLQELTKFYHVDILVTDITRSEQDDFIWRPVDKVVVRGREFPLTIYQPVGDTSATGLAELELYEQALTAYYAQDWLLAQKKFNALKKMHPEDYLYQIYSERIKKFRKKPPASDWEGIYTHDHK